MCIITFNSGLYHKLHGVPRPGTMKKTMIKRRKRVVAPPDGSFNSIKQTPTVSTITDSIPTPHTATSDTVLPNDESALRQLSQHTSDAVNMREEGGNMVNGDSSSGIVSHQSIASNPTLPAYNPRVFHPPIDFTSSFRSQSSSAPVASTIASTVSVAGSPTYNHEDKTLAPLQLNQNHSNSPGPNQPPPRKRSISVSSGGDTNEDGSVNPQRLNSINSILNPRSSSSSMDIPIEPSLLGFSVNGIDGEHQRIYHLREKRLRLMYEQKRLREEIDVLDKELATKMPSEGSGSGAVTPCTGAVVVNVASTPVAGRSGDRGVDNTGVNGTSGPNHRIL